jgi:hypothetical protein
LPGPPPSRPVLTQKEESVEKSGEREENARQISLFNPIAFIVYVRVDRYSIFLLRGTSRQNQLRIATPSPSLS